MQKQVYRWGLAFLFFIAIAACGEGDGSSGGAPVGDKSDLLDLPGDSGGTQNAFVLGSTPADYGFYFYIPGGYKDNGPAYPLLVFLHGAGEKGNSQTGGIDTLKRVLKNGPPKLIKNNNWDPSSPMLVISPQCHDGGWNANKLQAFIAYFISSYNVNEQRVYLTGLSMGGGGTFAYCVVKGQDALVAAAVPICGWGNPPKAANMKHIPVWAFHGDADGTVNESGSINMINAINAQNPSTRALLTIYHNVGHNSWARTYDNSGMGTGHADYDPFEMTIYDWMLKYKRPISN